MTDLTAEERKAMALGFLSMAKLLKPRVYYMAGFKQGREYSKQREGELREALKRAVTQLDLAGRRLTYLPYAREAHEAAERINAALAENGDSDA